MKYDSLPFILIGTRDQGQATGISQMFELVVKKFDEDKLPAFVIDLTLGTPTKNAGSLNIIRSIKLIGAIIRYLSKLPFSKSVYLTVGVSRLGFLRDAIILWFAFLFNKRTIIHVHSGGYGDFFNSQPAFIKFIIRKTLANIDHIIVLGEMLREQFQFLENVEQKIEIVNNALPSDLTPGSQTANEVQAGKPIRILYLSNLIESKGFLDVLKSCQILVYKKKIPVFFDFCGGFRSSVNDQQKSRIDTLNGFLDYVKKLGIEKFIKYHGIVSGKNKEIVLKEAHILVLPTYYSPEGQPTCIIEALAFGLPVIATNFRGIPEQIIDDFNGYFVDPRSPEQIADIIERIYRQPEKYRKLSENALRYYLEHFTPESHYRQIMPVLLGTKVTN
jgi:glycosyltransferase involved in cell wall biosynthesis